MIPDASEYTDLAPMKIERLLVIKLSQIVKTVYVLKDHVNLINSAFLGPKSTIGNERFSVSLLWTSPQDEFVPAFRS